MRKFGLIGYPLSHSFSKKYFTEKFEKEGIGDARYECYPIESITELPRLLANEPELVGLNVTIPYKEQVMAWLDELEPKAERIGAVNTIRIQNGKLKGFNTDYDGFKNSLIKWVGANPLPEKALILGTGGASKAVKAALEDLGIAFRFVSRKAAPGVLTYQDLNTPTPQHPNTFQRNPFGTTPQHFPKESLWDNTLTPQHFSTPVPPEAVSTLLINTTPLGMSPHTESLPDLPYEQLTSSHYLYDLVYNPLITPFMQKGIDAKCRVKNGLEMLFGQAEKAWEVWNAPLTWF